MLEPHPQPEGWKRREPGFALIVVLWVVALLALQVSIFNLSVRDAAALASNELAIARGEALAAAAIEVAAARLMDADPASRWLADSSTHELRFGDARLAIAVADEAGRFDIDEIDGDVADALLRPYGGSAEALARWTDSNGPLFDPSEVGPALGLPARAVQALAANLTVHGGDGKINPLVASREALLSLPGADPIEVERALRLRQRGLMTAADIARALGSVNKWLTERTGPAYRVRVEVHGEGVPAIGWAEATILIGKDTAAPFRVLSWRYEPTGYERGAGDRARDAR